MEKTMQLAAEQAPAFANDVREESGEVRTLGEMELGLVGGGDGTGGWP